MSQDQIIHGKINEQQKGQKIDVTILFDGIPVPKDYPVAVKVEVVIKDMLPAGEKDNWTSYILTLRDQPVPLDASKSLEEAGVKDKDVLSLTKKDGGGGEL